MIALAIQVLWLLLGVVVLCAVIWFVLYVLEQVMKITIPERITQMIWLIVLILVIIAILTIIAGGSLGNFHLSTR